MTKFLLIGLPGTGKTTSFLECVKNLNKRGIDCICISTDGFINTRIKPTDPVIIKYEEDHSIRIPPVIFAASNPSGAFISTYGEEPAFRDLEERFLIDIMRTSSEREWFDLGGKAFMRAGSVKATEDKKIVPIFLYAEHDTIISRLEKDEGWRQRPNYVNAASKSKDGNGWMLLAEQHRSERLEKHISSAKIIIAVEKNVEETFESSSQKKHYKSASELAHEIFFRVRELELASLNNQTQFGTTCLKYFEAKSKQNIFDKAKFNERSVWLSNNLKIKPPVK